MKSSFLLLLLSTLAATAQTDPAQLAPLLGEQIQAPEVTARELQRYVYQRIPRLNSVARPEQWTTEAKRLRQHLVNDVVFHGWPREWVEASPKFEDLGYIPSGVGYRMRKLRYEIVPGFYSAAILYEPASIQGKIPAVLNVNGHVWGSGKSIEYKQKRCINQARQGMFALNLEFLGFGELSQRENHHRFAAAHLDLAGANAVGLFYLAMRKGLDYLWEHPSVDRNRIGMTGLSGGGWQTIVLSALDERVAVAIPVAGYSAMLSRIQYPNDIGDFEQSATDLFAEIDYSHLTAMRAPRPTLIIHNADDDCCFRAALAKPDNFDVVVPFFRLYGEADRLEWHENTDPSTHNYQLDNRMASYRFFAKHFGLPEVREEIPVGGEIKSAEELTVGLPADNLSVLGVARKLARRIARSAPPSREMLQRTVRYQAVNVERAWMAGTSKRKGLETLSYRFAFTNELSATGIWLKAIASAYTAPATIVIRDTGRKAAQAEVSDRVNRGEQVLALDLLFTGDMQPPKVPDFHGFTQFLAAQGRRPLGMEAAQLVAVARWLQNASAHRVVRLESTGMRSQVISLVAAALAPGLFSEVVIREGMPSLGYLLDAPVGYQTAPDLFCLDLYKQFDLDLLAKLAAPARITTLH
jgi:dienelactone hydrolase